MPKLKLVREGGGFRELNGVCRADKFLIEMKRYLRALTGLDPLSQYPLEPPPTAKERAAALGDLARQFGRSALRKPNLGLIIDEAINLQRTRHARLIGGQYSAYLTSFPAEERL